MSLSDKIKFRASFSSSVDDRIILVEDVRESVIRVGKGIMGLSEIGELDLVGCMEIIKEEFGEKLV